MGWKRDGSEQREGDVMASLHSVLGPGNCTFKTCSVPWLYCEFESRPARTQ